MAESTQNLKDFLTEWGANSALDRSFLKGSGLEDGKAFSYKQDQETGVRTFESEDTQQKLNKLANYTVKETGEDTNSKYFTITRPDGKTQQTKLAKAKDTAFDKLMYSGAPIALLAGPLGAAMGLTGAAGLAAGGAITGAATGAMTGGNILKGAATGSLGGLLGMAAPGLSPVVAGAAGGGLSSLINGGNGKNALLAALLGGASGGMSSAGLSPLTRQLAMFQLRQALAPKGKG